MFEVYVNSFFRTIFVGLWFQTKSHVGSALHQTDLSKKGADRG